jgi:hypothetical protein
MCFPGSSTTEASKWPARNAATQNPMTGIYRSSSASGAGGGARASISVDSSTSAKHDAVGDAEAITRSSPEDVRLCWTDERVAFCRRLWAISDEDNEMVEPGGAAYANTLLQGAALNSTKSALDLSAGLGGGVRRMVGGLGL